MSTTAQSMPTVNTARTSRFVDPLSIKSSDKLNSGGTKIIPVSKLIGKPGTYLDSDIPSNDKNKT